MDKIKNEFNFKPNIRIAYKRELQTKRTGKLFDYYSILVELSKFSLANVRVATQASWTSF